jgi:hypothetical protein
VVAYFLHIPVNPLHWPLLAFLFPLSDSGSLVELWYTRLMFGLRHGPEVANRFTCAVMRLMRAHGWVCHGMLDDFWIQSPDRSHCWLGWCFLIAALTFLGFAVNFAPGKSIGPRRVQLMLGVEVDSVAMELRLDPKRVSDLVALLDESFLLPSQRGRFKVAHRVLNSAVGKLGWASHVVYGGSLFLNNVRAVLRPVRPPHHYVQLSRAAVGDLVWWRRALSLFNGKRRLPGLPMPACAFQTDARGVWDSEFPCIGVFVAGGFWSLSVHALHAMYADVPAFDAPIQLWELYAVVVAVRLFGDSLAGRHWCVQVDNANVHAWLTKGTFKGAVCFDCAVVMLSELFWESIRLDFQLVSQHVLGKDNELADALSRCEWARFRALLLEWLPEHDPAAPSPLLWLPPRAHLQRPPLPLPSPS